MLVKRIQICVAGMLLVILGLCLPSVEAKAAGNARIHFISLKSSTDAILLESNGHYGMVDSGEDWDYPDGDSYILRYGVTRGIGFEQQVIYYLKQHGVKKLDFYIATHSHSDHIGSGDEILREFPTDRLYIGKYDDSYIKSPSKDSKDDHLWDNQFCYDNLIKAAKETGTQIITDLDLEANSSKRAFALGDMRIEIMNCERDRDQSGNFLTVPDENCNTLVTKVTAYGRVALLTGDMDPWVRQKGAESDTVRVVRQLVDDLWSGDASQDTPQVSVDPNHEEKVVSEYEGVNFSTHTAAKDKKEGAVDESKVNEGRTISIDLLKMCHHAIGYNNTTYFLTSLNPKIAVITGYERTLSARERECLPNTAVYATTTDSASVIAEFQSGGIRARYSKVRPGWMGYDGKSYYFDENGRTYAKAGLYTINGKTYYMDRKGAVSDENQWIETDAGWRYWHKSGRLAKAEWIKYKGEFYYCNSSELMVTGWEKIRGSYYYFDSSGVMQKSQWVRGDYVGQDGRWVQSYSKGSWMKSGSRWWYRRGDQTYLAGCWQLIDGKWYYFDKEGWMVTGWKQIDDKWYYLRSDGSLAVDTWIGSYYVDASGVWKEPKAKDRWMKSGSLWWYRHADGSYSKNQFEKINGEWYYFDGSGWMVTGWRKIGSSWYYFAGSGAMYSNHWCGSYYLKSDGQMAVSEWVDGGRYYVDSDGRYQKQ